ncbi:HNH endonuclease [Roseofilum capinflatum]|uniref:HNH endonuclease n=1 Tax=Roseofilum capinflatum BLCC-M114 TaxID=3022440 RepID=A0ABT7B438_9CYAN|nr:HNH endonuclease [Roseofilum capinflatum]MDJ1173904.1 HNH endonuclease [Roseofilum capinflatum BLCC-M114]
MSQVRSEEDQRNLAYYCKCFSTLKVHKTKELGKAFHKPILLLSVIDLIGQGYIQNNRIFVSEELEKIFDKYWKIIVKESRRLPRLYYPFFHLKNEGFWHLEFKKPFKDTQIKSKTKLNEFVEYAYLDNSLFKLLQNDQYRNQLIDTLIASWFSVSQTKLEEILDINDRFVEDPEDSQDLANLSLRDSVETPTFRMSKSVVRKAFFRKSIVHIYDYRCAFCRLKVQRSLKQFIVDGAHIKRLSEFYDNSITNGLSLCKNHHWAFEMGWFFINEDYRIIVADDLEEDSPYARPMKDFHGERILLPSLQKDFPSLEALYWHRKKVFEAYS